MSLLSYLQIGKWVQISVDRLFPPPQTTWEHLRQNLIIGMFVVVLLTLFQGSDFVKSNREKSIDWLTRMHRGVTVANDRNFRPFVFYDIDEKTYESWGEPFFVPRPKLATLIETALQQNPSVLIVDVEILHPTGDDGTLIDVLRRHAVASSNATTLILLRSFKWKQDSDHGSYLVSRDSFLDGSLPVTNRQVKGSPLFERDPDGKIRRWKLWQLACTTAGEPLLVPSVQLLALAGIAASDDPKPLQQAILHATPTSCKEPASSAGHFEVGNYKFSLATNVFEQRILYSLPWRLETDETRPDVTFNGVKTRLLSIIPAHTITEGALRPSFPAGHVAIIGASHEDARDVHATPLGAMPGSLILINAMHSMIQHGQLSTPPVWLQLLTAAVLLIGVSFIFMKFPSLKGAIISFAVVIVLLIPMSMYLFRYGVWLDFALPLTAVKVFQLIMDYHRNRKIRRVD